MFFNRWKKSEVIGDKNKTNVKEFNICEWLKETDTTLNEVKGHNIKGHEFFYFEKSALTMICYNEHVGK